MNIQPQKSKNILFVIVLILAVLIKPRNPFVMNLAQPVQVALASSMGELVVNNQGAVSPFTVDTLDYLEQKVLAPDGEAQDSFGMSVAFDGNTAIVGAPYDSIGSNESQGSAYVFVWDGSTWTMQQKLTAPDGDEYEYFGESVALEGDTVVVGAELDETDSNFGQGSAYVFVRSGTTWSQQQKLTASDGKADDYFGQSVAISGDSVLVGSSTDIESIEGRGAVYVFVRSGTTWSEQQKLIASDGSEYDYFGVSVAISGDTALIGAYTDDENGHADQGSAYVFVRSGATWNLQQKLTATDGETYELFGGAVALLNDTALIGAEAGDVYVQGDDQGSAYIFTRSGSSWSQQQKLTATEVCDYKEFGKAVTLSEKFALVGAPGDTIEEHNGQGSVYVYMYDGSTWIEQKRLFASDGDYYENFGQAVALSGSTVLVGARSDRIGDNYFQGSAYFYDALPVVTTITRLDPNPTTPTIVAFGVAFSEDVSGVDASDFSLTTNGTISGATVSGVDASDFSLTTNGTISGATVSGMDGTGDTYIVTISAYTGFGTIQLDVPTSATVVDLSGNSLTGLPYTDGEVYLVGYQVFLPIVLVYSGS